MDNFLNARSSICCVLKKNFWGFELIKSAAKDYKPSLKSSRKSFIKSEKGPFFLLCSKMALINKIETAGQKNTQAKFQLDGYLGDGVCECGGGTKRDEQKK